VAGTGEYGKEPSGSIKMRGNFLTSFKDWLASQEELCSMEQISK
jgi:hypothetical protein